MDDPVFIVKFEKGLADRHRLPLSHVIAVLEEVQKMMCSVGREIQRMHGVQEPKGDFGLEVIADGVGRVFRKGSLQAPIAMTRDIGNAMQTANSVLATVQKLTKAAGAGQQSGFADPVERKIVSHLDQIARIQKPDKTELRFIVQQSTNGDGATGKKRPGRSSAVFGDLAIKTIRAARVPVMTADNVTLYGRLFELKDKNQEKDSPTFWGELRTDNGETWRVQFDASRTEEAARLFKKQVSIVGRVHYYRAFPPKIVVKAIAEDEERDYEAAFDELFGSGKEYLGGSDFATLLREMHGEV
jgi:hypothetical protein